MLNVVDEVIKDEMTTAGAALLEMCNSDDPAMHNLAIVLRSYGVILERLAQRDMERCTCVPRVENKTELLVDVECPWHGRH